MQSVPAAEAATAAADVNPTNAIDEVAQRRTSGRSSKRTKHYSGDVSKQLGTVRTIVAEKPDEVEDEDGSSSSSSSSSSSGKDSPVDMEGKAAEEPKRVRKRPGPKPKKKPGPKQGWKKAAAAAAAAATTGSGAAAAADSGGVPLRGAGGGQSSSRGGKPSRRSAANNKAPAGTDSPAEEDGDAGAAATMAGAAAAAAAAANGEAETSTAEVFLCPWPGCERQFDRIKSRSAHLKWHGGNYKGSNGGDAVRMPRKAGEDSQPQQDGGSASSGGGGGNGKKRGSGDGGKKAKRQRGGSSGSAAAAPPSPGFGIGAKIIMPSGEHAGKVGVVGKIEEDTTEGRVYHVVVDSGKGKFAKSKTIQVSSSAFNNTTQFTVGMMVFGRSITVKGPAFRAGTIEEIKDGESPPLYKFVPRGFESEASWVPMSDLLVDSAPSMSQLRTGIKVCALPGDKNGCYYYVGSIQRIESSRIRVNFDSFSIAWRKAHEVRLLVDAKY